MGNGASLNQRRPSAILSGFRSVEELVARGYFQDNVDAYKAAVEDNIRKEALDILEILVPAGKFWSFSLINRIVFEIFCYF
jgi:hypothetical protein